MIIGLLFVSLVTATLATLLGIGVGIPAWLALVIFPSVGTAMLLLMALFLAQTRLQHR